MKYTAAVGAIALLMAACGGDTGTTTTTGGSTSTITTSLPATTTSLAVSTTGGNGTVGPQVTLPPVIAQVAFAFASGDDPRVLVEVSVGESADGPWLPAGFSDETPTLTGPAYWVRFDITNTDQLNALLTDLDISGFDAGSFLGEDICELEAPLPRDGATVCIVGGFPVQPGGNQVDFVVGGSGPRQGGPDRWYDPALPTNLEFGGARSSFALIFGTPEGFRADGTADGSEVEIDIDGISGSLKLDCSGGSAFDGDPVLEAYVIENFSAGGDRVGGCADIPTAELEFFPDFDGDDAYLYFGAEDTTTSSVATTTTVPG
jgi:hypothetical protein